MPESPYITEIRRAVQALCAEFPGEYCREKDQAQAYPGEFVDAPISTNLMLSYAASDPARTDAYRPCVEKSGAVGLDAPEEGA